MTESDLLFDQHIAMEQMIGAIYRKFAARFPSCPEASELWNHMAAEEAQHASALYWCKRLVVDLHAHTGFCAASDEESRNVGMETIRTIMRFAESPDLTLEQAVFLTVRLEALGVEKLLGALLSLPENDIFRQVARQMVGDQEDHLKHTSTLVNLLPVMAGDADSHR